MEKQRPNGANFSQIRKNHDFELKSLFECKISFLSKNVKSDKKLEKLFQDLKEIIEGNKKSKY